MKRVAMEGVQKHQKKPQKNATHLICYTPCLATKLSNTHSGVTVLRDGTGILATRALARWRKCVQSGYSDTARVRSVYYYSTAVSMCYAKHNRIECCTVRRCGSYRHGLRL